MHVQSVTAAQVLSPGPAVPVSLWDWLARLPDPRDRRGVRFTLACVIAIAIAARLAGCDSFTAIGEWAASRPQRVLKVLGCPLGKRAGVYIAPSEKTVRRVAGPAGIDHDLAGDLLCGWMRVLARGGHVIFVIKGNQPRTYPALNDIAWEQIPVTAATFEADRGRIETRSIQVAPAPGGLKYLEMKQAALIERYTTFTDSKGKTVTRSETVLILTTASAGEAPPADLLALNRRHWAATEATHWIRSPGILT